MKFDICLPNAVEGFLAPSNLLRPQDLGTYALECERLGYNALWGFDFINPTPDMGIPDDETANWYELMTSLAYVSGMTERVRLVAGVAVLPNRDPVILAKQIATVDQLSGGRLDVGIGLGLRPEFKTLHPRATGVYRGDMVDERLEALKLLLDPDSGSVSYDGKHVAFEHVRLNPKPFQDPLPFLTAAETPAPLKRAARWGITPIIHSGALDERLSQYEPELEAVGKTLDDADVCVWADLRVDDTPETAADRYLNCTMARFAKKYRKEADDVIVARNWVGTVDHIVEKLATLKHRGIERLVVMHTVNETFDEMLEQTRRFAEEIMPRVENA